MAVLPIDAAGLHGIADRVTGRYAGASRFARGFVRGKLRSDPATAAILRHAAAAPFREVVDLGCGRGQLGLALLLAGLARRLVGVDRNAAKIAEARDAAEGLPAEFGVADLAGEPVPDCDTVLLVDVLYQMPESAQLGLLERAAAAARRRILIRAFDPGGGWRAQVGLLMEKAGRRLRRDGAEIRPLPLPTLQQRLRGAGFEVSITPCWGSTPLPNMLLLAERPLR